MTETSDFIVYKKIEDILWFDWDPIGVNDIAPRDEYMDYIPMIFQLKKEGADRMEIGEKLFEIEKHTIEMQGTLDNCIMIADKILDI